MTDIWNREAGRIGAGNDLAGLDPWVLSTWFYASLKGLLWEIGLLEGLDHYGIRSASLIKTDIMKC
jgi:hypothetical protein